MKTLDNMLLEQLKDEDFKKEYFDSLAKMKKDISTFEDCETLLKELDKGVNDMENNRLIPHKESMKTLKQRYKDYLNGIYAELAESRACYERGEYEDFDDALNEISAKYGL